mgnify:CR=1 FL=1|tara:strand:- start:506 stop:616 length:111 start_codon:yes stop_codon:yes gene_type:complete
MTKHPDDEAWEMWQRDERMYELRILLDGIRAIREAR